MPGSLAIVTDWPVVNEASNASDGGVSGAFERKETWLSGKGEYKEWQIFQ